MPQLEHLSRFKRGIAVVLGNIVEQSAAIVMFHVMPQIPDAPLDHHVLVHLAQLVAGLATTEEPQVPAWVVSAVPNPLIEKDEIAVHVKPVLRAAIFRGDVG